MSDYDLGTARGRIEIDYNGNGIGEAERGLRGLGSQVSSTGEALNTVGNVAGGAGLAIAGGLALAVNKAADFEKGLSAIQAVSGNTASEMEKVRAKALQIGKDTAFGATDAAAAMEELAKAGVSTADILGGAADATVALAAAGEIDLPFAAEIASNAMNQFSLKAQALPHVADLIAGAANASAISVEDFGYSLSQVGAVANLAGLSLDDTAIAIAEMGNAGIKGSDAGTSLKTMLSNLQPTTDKAKSALEDMGIVTKDGTNLFYDQEGRLKSLRDIQDLLAKGTKGYTAAQKQAALQTIFGSDAIRAAAILTKSGADGYDKMNAAIGKTKAADVAAARMNNLKGDIEKLKGSAETLAINLGTVLLPTLRDIVESVDGFISAFTELSPEMQKIIVFSAAGASGFLLFAAATIKIVGIMREFIAVMRVLRAALALGPLMTAFRIGLLGLTTAMRAFGLAMYTALGPIGLIILAVIAFIAIMVLLYNKNETVRKAIQAAWAFIKSVVGAVVSWFVNTAGPALMKVLASIGNFFKKVGQDVADTWNDAKRITSAVLGAIGTIIKAYFNAYVTVVRTVMNAIKSTALFIWRAILAGIRGIVNTVRAVVTGAFNAMRSAVTSAGSATRSAITGAWNGILNAARSVWARITSVVRGAVNAMISVVRGIRGRVVGVFSGAGGWLLAAGRNIIGGLINGIKGMLGSLQNTLGNVTNLIPDWKGPASRDKVLLEDNGSLIMQGLLKGIGSQVGPLRNLLMGITNDIPTFAGGGIAGATNTVAPQASEFGSAASVVVNNYNPVAEASSVQTTKSMTRLAQLGVLG